MQEGASVQQPNRENPEFLINACMYTKVYIFNIFNKERIKTQVLISPACQPEGTFTSLPDEIVTVSAAREAEPTQSVLQQKGMLLS